MAYADCGSALDSKVVKLNDHFGGGAGVVVSGYMEPATTTRQGGFLLLQKAFIFLQESIFIDIVYKIIIYFALSSLFFS